MTTSFLDIIEIYDKFLKNLFDQYYKYKSECAFSIDENVDFL